MKKTVPKHLPANFQNISPANRLRSLTIEKAIYTPNSPIQEVDEISPVKRSRNKSIDFLAAKRKEFSKKEVKDEVSLVTYLACQNNRLLNFLELKSTENQELNANLEALSTEINSLTDEGQFILGEDAKVVISQNENLRTILNEKGAAIQLLKEEIEKKNLSLSEQKDFQSEMELERKKTASAQNELISLQNDLQTLYRAITEINVKKQKRLNCPAKQNYGILANKLKMANLHLEKLEKTKSGLEGEIERVKTHLQSQTSIRSMADYLSDSAEMRSSISEMKCLLKAMDEHIENHKKEQILASIAKINSDRLSLQLKSK